MNIQEQDEMKRKLIYLVDHGMHRNELAQRLELGYPTILQLLDMNHQCKWHKKTRQKISLFLQRYEAKYGPI